MGGLAAMVAMMAGIGSADLGWLAGHWLACSPGRETSETWTDARGGVMIGMGKTIRPGRSDWEFTRIEASQGRPTFFAQPSHQAAAEFPAIETGERRVVFENPTHDFPQRVIYRREGKDLIGRIEGTVAGRMRSAEWHYRPAAIGATCP